MSNGTKASVLAGLGACIILLSTMMESYGSSEPESAIDVQLGNKTYSIEYRMTNGSSIQAATAESYPPYGGWLSISLESPEWGYLEVTLPREFYDAIGFTPHQDDFAIFVDGVPIDLPETIHNSCDKITMEVPIQENSEIEFLTGDHLGMHEHGYPPALHVTEKIATGEAEFNVHMWTDAIKCDVSFSKEQKKLHIDIQGRNETNGGDFSIAIPPELLGGNYTVLADGKKVNFTEQQPHIDYIGNSSESITLTRLGIKYPANATAIDVVGTTSIPEFGSIIVVLMAIGIIGSIIITKRFSMGTDLNF